MNDLLKEAIADAKAVREIALANAKLALEEAMTPRLQSMLSRKLAEEAEGDEEETSVEEDYGNDWFEEEPGSVSEVEDEDESDESALEKVHEEDNEDGKSVETAEDDIDIDELFGEADEEEGELPAEEMDEADEEEIDEDLMEIIRQLEEDIDSSGIGTGDNKKPSPAASGDSTKDTKEKLVQLVNEEDEEDEDIKEMMRSIREEDEEEPKKHKVEEAEDEDDDTVDIKEILRALREEEDGEEKDESEKEKEMTEARLREAYAVITFLRSKINEVNLLNSKLLFSNKLFKKNSLTEKQKITVIENFDRASSLREVKLVYATLSEALKSAKVNTKHTKQLKESFASKPIASTRPKTIINEGDDMANRLRKLAGLK